MKLSLICGILLLAALGQGSPHVEDNYGDNMDHSHNDEDKSGWKILQMLFGMKDDDKYDGKDYYQRGDRGSGGRGGDRWGGQSMSRRQSGYGEGDYRGQNDWGSVKSGGWRSSGKGGSDGWKKEEYDGNMWQKLMSYMKGGNDRDKTRWGSSKSGGWGPSSKGGYGGWDKGGDDKSMWQKMMSCILTGGNYGEQNFISFVNEQIFANAEGYLNSDGQGKKSTYGDRTEGSYGDQNDRSDGDMLRNMMSIIRNYGGQNGWRSDKSGGWGSSGKGGSGGWEKGEYDGDMWQKMMSYMKGGSYGGQNDWGSDESGGWRSSGKGRSDRWGKGEDDKNMWQKMMSCMQRPIGGNYGKQNFVSFVNRQIFANLEGYANIDGRGRKSTNGYRTGDMSDWQRMTDGPMRMREMMRNKEMSRGRRGGSKWGDRNDGDDWDEDHRGSRRDWRDDDWDEDHRGSRRDRRGDWDDDHEDDGMKKLKKLISEMMEGKEHGDDHDDGDDEYSVEDVLSKLIKMIMDEVSEGEDHGDEYEDDAHKRQMSGGGRYDRGYEDDDEDDWNPRREGYGRRRMGGGRGYGAEDDNDDWPRRRGRGDDNYGKDEDEGPPRRMWRRGEKDIKADLKTTIKQLIKVIIHRQSKVTGVDQSRAKNCATQCATDLACPNGTEISSHLASTPEMCQTCFKIACDDQQDSACFIVVRKVCSKLCPSDVLESRKEEEKACTNCLESCYDIDQEDDGDEENGSHHQVSRNNTRMGDNDHQGTTNVTQVQSSMGQSDE